MRFGKRGRGRSIGRREASKASKRNTTAPVPQQGSVAPVMEENTEASDARTQDILTYLGHFSEQLANTQSAHWPDTCMNDLIACMEITIEEGWGDLSQMLADTGRILQSYENVHRALEAIPFLEDAYDAMCRLVGDMVIEKSTNESLEYWAKVFRNGQEELSNKGLTLYEDSAAMEETQSDTPLDESPNESTPSPTPNTLPILNELPPLESLVSFNSTEPEEKENADDQTTEAIEDDSAFPETDDGNVIAFTPLGQPHANSEKIIDTEDATPEVTEETTEEIQEEAPAEQYDPPRIVVDIIDRICDVLGALEHDTGDARTASLKIMTGGLEALAHEALLMKSTVAQEACATMTQACNLVSGGDETKIDGLVEQSFAFCSVFIEALTDPDSENIMAWQLECSEWIDACTSTPTPPVLEAPSTPSQNTTLKEPFVEAQYEVVENSTQGTEDRKSSCRERV